MANQSARDRADALLAAWNRRDYDAVSDQFDDEGRIKGMRTYGDLWEVPLAAHPTGVG